MSSKKEKSDLLLEEEIPRMRQGRWNSCAVLALKEQGGSGVLVKLKGALGTKEDNSSSVLGHGDVQWGRIALLTRAAV